jgi:GMP synthase-like glutamine amidotransferase
MMIALFQHGSEEPAGEIETYLTEYRVPHSTLRLFENDTIPKELPSRFIILGGQMSVNDSKDYPFFKGEKRVIREMVAAEKPVLGICLGAQMIASAFGQEVIRGPCEQGWTRIHGCGTRMRPLFPETFTAFHWHNETFNLPEGAKLLATGAVVKNQAFRLGSAVGVQFHPEVTGQIISCWSKDLQAETKRTLMQDTDQYREMNRQHCRTLIDQFLRGWDS